MAPSQRPPTFECVIPPTNRPGSLPSGSHNLSASDARIDGMTQNKRRSAHDLTPQDASSWFLGFPWGIARHQKLHCFPTIFRKETSRNANQCAKTAIEIRCPQDHQISRKFTVVVIIAGACRLTGFRRLSLTLNRSSFEMWSISLGGPMFRLCGY